MDEKLRIVKPYGRLFTQRQEYFLLVPHAIVGDSWERDSCYRFLVVPTTATAMEQRGRKSYAVYGYARHIVTNAFVIEYKHDIEDIAIPVLDEIDVTLQEAPKENEDVTEKDELPY